MFFAMLAKMKNAALTTRTAWNLEGVDTRKKSLSKAKKYFSCMFFKVMQQSQPKSCLHATKNAGALKHSIST